MRWRKPNGLHRQARAALSLGVFIAIAAPNDSKAYEWEDRTERAIRELESKLPKVRSAALEEMAELPLDRVREHILKALKDPVLTVRRAAGETAVEHRMTEIAPTLFGWLSHWDTEMRRAAATFIGRLQPKSATKALARALADPEHLVRLSVLRTLERTANKLDPSVTSAIVSKLEDTHSSVRHAALDVLVRFRSPRTVLPIMSLLNDPAHEVRRAAALSLGIIGDTRAAPALVRLLSDAKVPVVTAAIQSLGRLQYMHAVVPLSDILRRRRSKEHVRKAAIVALAQIGNRHAIDILATLVGHPRHRDAAVESLATLPASKIKRLVRLLQKPDIPRDIALAILKIIERGGHTFASPMLVSLLDHARLPTLTVLRTLGRLKSHAAQRALLRYVRHPDRDLQLVALRSLERNADGRAATPLLGLLDDRDQDIQWLAISILGRLRNRIASTPLLRLARKAGDRTARRATTALARIADPRTASGLVDLLAHRDREVRRAALRGLAAMDPTLSAEMIIERCDRLSSAQRNICLHALGITRRGRRDAIATAYLVKELGTTDHSTLLAVLDALSAMAPPESAEPLLKRWQSVDEKLRSHTLRAFGSIPGDRVASVLTSSLSDPNPTVAAASAWALGTQRRPPIKRLVTLSRGGHWAVRVNATAALTQIAHRLEGHALREVFASLLGDRNPYVRANAMRGIRLTGATRSDIVSLVFDRARTDPNAWVRINALRCLKRGGFDRKARKLTTESSDNDPDPQVRHVARNLLREPQAHAPENQAPDHQADWVGLYLYDVDRLPLRNALFVLVDAAGSIRVAQSDLRGQYWAYRLPPGPVFVELPAAQFDQLE